MEKELSRILVDPRVTSRGASSLSKISLRCLTLSVRHLPDVGGTNEIKTLALCLSSPENKSMSPRVSEKKYVEGGSNLISFANVFKSLFKSAEVDWINRRSRGTGAVQSVDIEVTRGVSDSNWSIS